MTLCARSAWTARTYRGALAALLAGGVLLTAGCSDGGGRPERASADDARRGPGLVAPDGGGGAPAPPGPEDGKSRDEEFAEPERSRPPADYLSTFALDVDTASYGYARRTLKDGRLPRPEDIRPEEFVNSFRQDYPKPGGNGFSVSVDGARTDPSGVEGEVEGEIKSDTGDGEWSLVRVGLATGFSERTGERPPAALTFVIDVSGSMSEPGRLDLVKKSLGILTDELRDDDSIAVVTFSKEAETRLPMTRLGAHRDRVHRVVDRLEAGDSTNVEAGVTTGYDVAVKGRRSGATNRVVLLSDALANTGETEADAILDRIDDARSEFGITLFGVGVGSRYGDALMERLADKGDGHTTYVSTEDEARKVFVDQLPRNLELRARDAKAQVAFDPQTVRQFKLIGYENRAVEDEDFRDDRVDGGEIGPGHTVTALYAVRLREGARGHVATATVRWLDPKSRAPHERSGSIETDAIAPSLWRGDVSPRLQVTAVAAYFAESLRDGSLPGAPGLRGLAGHARKLAATTEDGAVSELADAIDRARGLRD
ncbi:von Willebrand factor type A domain-containing protein [Streptomyces sp. HNM0663]|uniref:von Willebrand factor type A domain-containing protein n=1 Tax=Streptomyces chengmaiensis TaxID=3040919 RepID=A0ABT6HSK6_9ACTN|nr:von Willebrand factor type A domain-containing protein [Streptomyces chengmaiensis]MDH2391693.1 von Willebrand factor type A domain-containing protein [Streptomyces chengmaiensis]